MLSRLFGKGETVTWWYIPWKEDCTIEKGTIRVEKWDIDSNISVSLLKWVLDKINLYIYLKRLNDPTKDSIMKEYEWYFFHLWIDLWCDARLHRPDNESKGEEVAKSDWKFQYQDWWEWKDIIS